MANTRKAKAPSQKKKSRPQPGASQKSSGPNWTVILGSAAAAIVIVGFVWLVARDVGNPLPEGSGVAPDSVEQVAMESPLHTEEPVAYPTDPPAGGPHDPVWLRCRAYDEPVRNENAVHALEHGAVWLSYQPGVVDDATVSELERFANRAEIIVSPYPGQPAPIVLTAWGQQLQLDAYDESTVADFISAFQNVVAPENAATC